MRAGVIRAEGQVTTTAPASSDRVVLQKLQSNGQFYPQEIAYSNFVKGQPQSIQVYLSPITAQAGAVSVLFAAPYAGIVTGISAAVSGAFTSTNIVITPSIYTAPGTGAAITGGAVTLATAASGVGTTSSATPSAANTFAAGNVITATVTGGVGTVTGVITLFITRTA